MGEKHTKEVLATKDDLGNQDTQDSLNSNDKTDSNPNDDEKDNVTIRSYQNDDRYSYDLRITKDRIAVLIGSKGETKNDLESETGCKINVDSKEGDITISGTDAISLFALREVIKAVSRGFNPDIAKQLLKQDYALEVITLNDYSKEKSQQQRLKGRVIGLRGKSRSTIEALTECTISVYGKTVSMIGSVEYIGNCKRAVEMLLSGSPHANVYKWLERQRRLNKQAAVESAGF